MFVGIKRVLNADQTAVFFEYLPSKTLAPKGTSRVFIHCAGKEKDRLTDMVLADCSGKKDPLFLVLKTRAVSCQTNAVVDEVNHGFGAAYYDRTIEPLEVGSGCEIYGNKPGWWNEGLSLAFLEFHFARRPDIDTDKVLLLWDDRKAHFTPRVHALAKALNVVLLKVRTSLKR